VLKCAGNVSYACPSFHGSYVIPTRPGEHPHNAGFTRAASTPEAHDLTISVGKGIALVGWKILSDDAFAKQVKADFNEDKLLR